MKFSCILYDSQAVNIVMDCCECQGGLVAVGVMSNSSRQSDSSSEHVVLANYITSPPLVIAYAIAGKVLLDFESEPVGMLTEK